MGNAFQVMQGLAWRYMTSCRHLSQEMYADLQADKSRAKICAEEIMPREGRVRLKKKSLHTLQVKPLPRYPSEVGWSLVRPCIESSTASSWPFSLMMNEIRCHTSPEKHPRKARGCMDGCASSDSLVKTGAPHSKGAYWSMVERSELTSLCARKDIDGTRVWVQHNVTRRLPLPCMQYL